MLQILGNATSINVRKVLWTCVELDQPFDLVPHGAEHRATDTPAHLALNPNALVPVIRDGDLVLWESNTICRYLAAARGRTDLLPSAAAGRAVVEQWMDWQATALNPAWRYAFMARVRGSADCTDPAAIDASVANWNRHMVMLDERLQATGAWVAGPAFTLADVVIGLSVNRSLMTPMERPALAAVAGFVARLSTRAGWRRHGANGTP